ncbi:autotransporter domain-containing protein, partial [Acidocella sp.]|uniref:autotransporter outer membrane beta-barrel domain-containing protein n=1 Tax=Acidocella sp. TaxID=50710 RepID=UPI00260D5A71
GTVASLDNQSGSFTNTGFITGNVTQEGGSVTSSGTILGTVGQTGGVFTNQTGGTTGAFTENGGSASNAGTVASLDTQSGSFTNTGTIAGNVTVSGGVVTSSGTINAALDTVSGGTLDITGGTMGATSGALALSGGLVDLGGTTQTLNGGLTLTGGTLQNGTLSSTGTFAVQQGVISASLAGTGGLDKTTTGTVTVSGANSYTGPTTVEAGTLLAGAANVFAPNSATTVDTGATLDLGGYNQTVSALSGGGVVTDGGTLTNQGASSLFSGTITDGAGHTSLAQTGAGATLTLSGNNSYTGTTSIATGSTLALTGSGAIASSSDVADNGTFDISATTAGAAITSLDGAGIVTLGAQTLSLTNAAGNFSGDIQGTGGLSLASGTETLSGNNSYTGATSIATGTTLALAGAGAIAASSGVADNGTFDISATSNGAAITTLSGNGTAQLGGQTLSLTAANNIFAGNLAGSGGFDLTGGTEILDGNSSGFTGTTDITGGMLEVGDAADPGAVLGGNVLVGGGGMLRGHGSIDGNVTNGGVVEPGGSIGILTINGNYTQTSGGTLNIEVTPSAVAGTGYDQLVVNGAASLAGTLAVQVDSGTYTIGTAYDILTASSGVTGQFSTVNYNPLFASYITPVVNYGANNVTIELVATSTAFAGGRAYVAGSFVQDGALLSALSAPLSAGPESGNATDDGYWLHGIGSFGTANGYDTNAKGFVVGKGVDVSPNLVLGAAVSNLYTNTSGGGSSVHGTSVGGLVYGIYNANQLTLSGDVGAGYLHDDFARGLTALNETAHATSTGSYVGAALRLQEQLMSGTGYFLTPYATVSYLHTNLGGMKESGAGILDLRYGTVSSGIAQFGAGLTGGYSVPVRYGTLTSWASLGGLGTLGDRHNHVLETLGSTSVTETAQAAPAGAVTPAVGVELSNAGRWALGASWGGQYSGSTSNNTFSLQANYVW